MRYEYLIELKHDDLKPILMGWLSLFNIIDRATLCESDDVDSVIAVLYNKEDTLVTIENAAHIDQAYITVNEQTFVLMRSGESMDFIVKGKRVTSDVAQQELHIFQDAANKAGFNVPVLEK